MKCDGDLVVDHDKKSRKCRKMCYFMMKNNPTDVNFKELMAG